MPTVAHRTWWPFPTAETWVLALFTAEFLIYALVTIWIDGGGV